MNGQSVGVVANQPKYLAGVLDSNAALAQIMAFTTFAVSFLARPFGSMLLRMTSG